MGKPEESSVRSSMNFLKQALFPLALLALISMVTSKPKHLLVKTKNKSSYSDDYSYPPPPPAYPPPSYPPPPPPAYPPPPPAYSPPSTVYDYKYPGAPPPAYPPPKGYADYYYTGPPPPVYRK